MNKFRTMEFTYRMDPCLHPGPPITARYLRFGPFHLDQQRQQVFHNGTELRLQGKVYGALIVLLQNQGEVVTREELKRALWPTDSHVNYNANLNTTVNKLRRTLSESESTNKLLYIETIPRRGYSFAGAVEFSDIPFPRFEPANSATQAIEPGCAQEARMCTVPRSGKSLTVIVALVLAGILLGATAATFWISRVELKSATWLRKNF